MIQSDTDRDRFKAFAGEYRQRLVEGMARVYGDRASDAVKLSAEDEINEYRRPTSPAALLVLERGGSLEEAEAANALWAQDMKRQQQEAIRQGAKPQDLEKAGLSDAAIFKACRAQAWEMGETNGHGIPTKVTKYHEDMSKKVAEARQKGDMSYATVGIDSGATDRVA